MNDERFAEIESLVAAFDCPEDENNDKARTTAAVKTPSDVTSQDNDVKDEPARDSTASGAPILAQGKIHKKRGRKSKEEKARLAKLAADEAMKGETDESRSRKIRSERLAAAATVEFKSEEDSKLGKVEQKKPLETDVASGSETSESKVQKARRTGGAPTKKEGHKTDSAATGAQAEGADAAASSSQKEIPTVVGKSFNLSNFYTCIMWYSLKKKNEFRFSKSKWL